VTSAIRFPIAALAVLLAVAQPAFPQNPLAATTGKDTAQASPPAMSDPLGRETPAGTVMGFLAASAKGDWPRASRFLDTKTPEAQAEETARELKILLDRGLNIDLDRLSRKPEGERDERLPKDHELVGSIDTQSGKLEVVLVRVRHGDQPPVWLFSAETLRGVPAAHEEYEPSLVEQYLPQSLTRGYGRSYMSWSWLVMLASVAAAFFLAMLLTRALGLLGRMMFRRVSATYVGVNRVSLLRPTRWLALGVLLRVLSTYFLTVNQRYLGAHVAMLLIIASVTWMGIRLLTAAVGRWVRTLERQGKTELVALGRLVSRLLQTAAVVIGILVSLQSVGINLTPVLAGLGVGGIAIALASQKTLENLFGGIMVIGDSPIRIGNFCRVGTMSGTVEDIGLRSTRIRTVARTVIAIPNADLAIQSIENFSWRDKMLFNHTFTLRYETTAEQLRSVLEESRTLLRGHAMIETSTVRVRLLRFAPSGLDVELFAYVTSTDIEPFLAIQEDLLLRLIDTIEASGTALAFPSQTTYFRQDTGLGRPGRPLPDLAPDRK